MKEADDNSVTQIDLSIETDLKKLIRNEQSKQFLSWGMYGLGFISIGLFWMVDRAKRKPDIHHVRRRSIQSCCQQISRLSLGENFSSELGATLRELQTLVRENCSGRKSRELLADGEFSEELDQLISQCDAMAFRPNPPTTDEQRNLLTSARSLVARI